MNREKETWKTSNNFLLTGLRIIFEERERGEIFYLTLAMYFKLKKILLRLETI